MNYTLPFKKVQPSIGFLPSYKYKQQDADTLPESVVDSVIGFPGHPVVEAKTEGVIVNVVGFLTVTKEKIQSQNHSEKKLCKLSVVVFFN